MTTPHDNLRDTLPGRQIDEYRIEVLLGTGGMAHVYRAVDTRLNRYVALKVIAPDFRADSDYAQRFEREAQSIARLDHPNIVHIYRFGESNGLFYMAMEYVQGVDVGWLIQDYKKDGEVMPLESVSSIIRDISAALDYAHSKQVIHRDVKPGNILVDNSGRAVLTDFGLALLGDVGTRGEIFGSPYYIAPEQAISSGNVVPQSDFYALGVTLFEMLTGELPFNGNDPMDVAMQHVSDTPPAPSSVNPALSHSFDSVVLKALEKEPSRRYATGSELSSVFQQAVGVLTVPTANNADTVRRPSLISTPSKVQAKLTAHSLPPLPAEANAVSSHTEPSFLGSENTQVRINPSATTMHNSVPSDFWDNLPNRQKWVYPILFAAGLFGAGLICLLVALFAIRNNSVAAVPTSSPTSATTPPLTETFAPTATIRLTDTATFVPTPTALVLPTNMVIGSTDAPSAPSLPVMPTARTLLLRGGENWIAFVNISDKTLSLAKFELTQDKMSMTAQEGWGKSQLLPGECLRIASKQPKDLPKGCNTVFDYSGKKEMRDRWLKNKTTVSISSSTKYCYPADKCSE